MTTGPQLLLDSAATVETKEKTGTVCYYAFADDEVAVANGGAVHKWKHACFADLSCIRPRPVGVPAFMSLRVGLDDRPCDDDFVRWLFDPELSPWREYTDELLPTKPMFLNWKGAEVNIHSHEFRRDVGVVLLKSVSRRVGINFLKAYRLLGEHPEFVHTWHEMVTSGMHPTDAFWSAQFVYPQANNYSVPYYYGHNIFRYDGDGSGLFVDLANMRDGVLTRKKYEDDESMLFRKGKYSVHGFYGCDAIWSDTPRPIKFNGTVRNAVLTRVKNEKKASLFISGLRSRACEVENAYMVSAPKPKVVEVFQSLIQEMLK